jgi:hypothetical protein
MSSPPISYKSGKYNLLTQVPYLHESTIAIVMGALTAVFSKYVPHLLIAGLRIEP